MIKKDPFASQIKHFSEQLKRHWQIFFLPSALLYSLSLLHFFYALSQPRALEAIPKSLDRFGFLIAAGLTVTVFNLKRKYYSRNYCRHIIAQHLREHPSATTEQLLNFFFKVLKPKIFTIWLPGTLLILEGVVFYWLTLKPEDMNLYFMVGCFSLLINYPREAAFLNFQWYIIECQKSSGSPANASPSH